MTEGYDLRSGDDAAWRDLDEYLCEYVDGEMDPVVRHVFDELIRSDPDLATHVTCLCQVREVLKSHCSCASAPADFVPQLSRRIVAEDVSTWVPSDAPALRWSGASIVTTVALLVLAALLAAQEPQALRTAGSGEGVVQTSLVSSGLLDPRGLIRAAANRKPLPASLDARPLLINSRWAAGCSSAHAFGGTDVSDGP
jgi:anti-sigma factor RsiW